ncbi:MAG: septal ring lytic transglycosylase RlpA family protein [Desulfovibrio sp.]|nr:septal ring lytic transglycosylase RlpA family protein [Desulfovibrio sp.]
MRIVFAIVVALLLTTGCSQKAPYQKGGKAGIRPYTVKGETYYPLKSASGFREEGLASWYGPGFHGKKTASGEKFNQYAMTAAHKILPLGSKARVTHLGNGRSVIVRVNDRGPFAPDRVIDLSKGAATRLGMIGSGTARVRVQSLGDLPQADESGDIKGKYYIQVGAFGNRENAQKLIGELARAKNKGRLIFGNNNMWNVQAGPWPDSASAQERLKILRRDYPLAFVVGGGS